MKITDISKFLIGDTLVGSIYIGSTKVWSGTTPPGPTGTNYFYYENVDENDIELSFGEYVAQDKRFAYSRDAINWQDVEYIDVPEKSETFSLDYLMNTKGYAMYAIRISNGTAPSTKTGWDPTNCEIFYNIGPDKFSFDERTSVKKATYVGELTYSSYTYYIYVLPGFTQDTTEDVYVAHYNPNYLSNSFTNTTHPYGMASSYRTSIFKYKTQAVGSQCIAYSTANNAQVTAPPSNPKVTTDFLQTQVTIVEPAHVESNSFVIPVGGKFYIRNKDNQAIGIDEIVQYNDATNNFVKLTGLHNVGGNIESLYDYQNIGQYSKARYLGYFFVNDVLLVNAKDLELPGDTLENGGYPNMFVGCTSLVTAPVLPATELANYCYQYMFQGCSSLIAAPELPGTTLKVYCYSNMFAGCTSLVSAPELPATELANYCYNRMFINCTSLVTAPELPATELATNCYEYMFQNCTSLVTAPELPATELAIYCYRYMFQGCTSLVTAPELPATTLANYCYQHMFENCTSLTTAPVLPATNLASYCYQYMFQGCTNLNYIKAMFTSTPTATTTFTTSWVNGVSATGKFYKNKAATWSVTGAYGIPEGWTVYTVSA